MASKFSALHVFCLFASPKRTQTKKPSSSNAEPDANGCVRIVGTLVCVRNQIDQESCPFLLHQGVVVEIDLMRLEALAAKALLVRPPDVSGHSGALAARADGRKAKTLATGFSDFIGKMVSGVLVDANVPETIFQIKCHSSHENNAFIRSVVEWWRTPPPTEAPRHHCRFNSALTVLPL